VTTLTTEHVDIGLVEGGAFGLHWHDETNDAEYEPGEAIATVNPALTTTHNSKSYYLLPSSQLAQTLYLGIGAEDGFDENALAFDSWDTDDTRLTSSFDTGTYLRLNLISVTTSTPNAELAVWDSLGDWFDTSNGVQTGTDGDVLYVTYGGHSHFNWGFTELGTYDVELSVSGTVNGVLETSDSATFQFVVPEPTSAALLAGLGGLALIRRRKA
jgi:surface-anchored protein